jgi:hypothetical protein
VTVVRTALLAGVVDPRRIVGADREHAAYDHFCMRHGLTPSAQAVTLYLTSLLDSGHVHGRGLRYRLHLLDLHARIAGMTPPSQDPDLRRYLRGLHRAASLALPEKGVDPLHVELLHTVLDAIAKPRRPQLRDAAVLLLANATGLPTQVLSALRWDHVRFQTASIEVTVPPMPRRGPRLYSPLTVPATAGASCPREALLRWRREAGPAQQPVFSLNGRSCDVSEIRPVVALLSRSPSRAGNVRPRLAGDRLEGLVARILAPQPRAVRDRALLLLAFTAALGTDEAARLLQANVVTTDKGLRLRLPNRAQLWTAVPASRHDAPCPADAWRGWQQVMRARGVAGPDRPAFTRIAGVVVKPEPLQDQGLNLIVDQACAAAALRGDWSFTSLRSGFIRTAIRAGAPEHIVGRQAGLTALKSVGTHACREQLVRQNAAGQVGL